MKRISFALLLLLTTLALAACGGAAEPEAADTTTAPGEQTADGLLADILERGVVRVSTDPNYEPQSFLDESGEFIGFDVDVAREIAARLGVAVEFVTPDWDIITAGNWGGQWDMSVGSMTVTTARQEVLDFASPAYYYTPAQFAAADGSGIESLDDLAGQVVCVGVSTTYETWLSGNAADLGLPAESFFAEPPAGVTIIPLATDAECPQSIQAGRQEFLAFLTSNTVVQAAIDGGLLIHRVGSPVFSENLAVAFDKGSDLDNASAVQRVGEIIQAMHDDGTLRQLSMKWFAADLTAAPSAQ